MAALPGRMWKVKASDEPSASRSYVALRSGVKNQDFEPLQSFAAWGVMEYYEGLNPYREKSRARTTLGEIVNV
jgi:hypothetical protein